MSVTGPAKVLFNGPLKTLKRQTQMCVRAQGQRRLTDLKQEEGCEGMLEDKTTARRKVESVRKKKVCEKVGRDIFRRPWLGGKKERKKERSKWK